MKMDAKRENPSRDWALGKGASFTARLFLAAVLLAALTPLFAGRLSAQAAAPPTEGAGAERAGGRRDLDHADMERRGRRREL